MRLNWSVNGRRPAETLYITFRFSIEEVEQYFKNIDRDKLAVGISGSWKDRLAIAPMSHSLDVDKKFGNPRSNNFFQYRLTPVTGSDRDHKATSYIFKIPCYRISGPTKPFRGIEITIEPFFEGDTEVLLITPSQGKFCETQQSFDNRLKKYRKTKRLYAARHAETHAEIEDSEDEASGEFVDSGVEISYTGLRPGEKLDPTPTTDTMVALKEENKQAVPLPTPIGITKALIDSMPPDKHDIHRLKLAVDLINTFVANHHDYKIRLDASNSNVGTKITIVRTVVSFEDI